ncbi:MAG: DUF2330 domain-containing protein [Armatimonadota bacterium]
MRTLRLSAASLLFASLIAHADGGYFAIADGVAQTADQRAVIIDHGDAETIVLQTGHDGDASDFAWVIPTPTRLAGVSSVSTADPAVFTALDELTAPRYYESAGAGPAICGCSGDNGAGAGGAPVRGDVTVWDSFAVENYDIVVLSADESSDLATWLDDNGYHLPAGSADVLHSYVSRHWFFVAIRMVPSAGGGGGAGDQLRPITLTFSTDELVFPMHISRVSTAERVEVMLYVISDGRVRSSNYPTAEIEARSSWRGQSFEAVYDGWFERTIANLGGTALVVECARSVPSQLLVTPPFDALLDREIQHYVTRLRTRLTPAQMTEDIVLVADERGADVGVVVASGVPGLRPRIAMATLLLAAIQAVAFRSRPRSRRIASATVLLAVFIVLL